MSFGLSLSSHYENHEDIKVTEGIEHVQTGEDFEKIYTLGGIIGRGSVSVVRVATHRVTGQQYACKIVDKLSAEKKHRLRDEIKILMAIRHENIISLHAIFETKREILLIIDLAKGGELFDRIVDKEKYSEHEAGMVISSLLNAIAFLHSQNIIHRDLKPENILLDTPNSDIHIKISDFGLAKVFDEVEDHEEAMDIVDQTSANGRLRAYTSCGTDYYVAPEVLKSEGYGPQVDMWSIGVIMYILLCGFPPFYDENGDMSIVYEKIKTGTFEFVAPNWDGVSEGAKNLICGLLTVDPDTRLTAEGALNHPWIRCRSKLTTDSVSPHFHAMFSKFNAKRKLSNN